MIRLLLRVGDNPQLQEFSDDAITIGRASANHLVIADPRVSRLHARIEKRSDGIHIVDLNSGNGTRLNGEKIASDVLLVGDTLQIGPTRMRVEDLEAGGALKIPVVVLTGKGKTTVTLPASRRRVPPSFRRKRGQPSVV